MGGWHDILEERCGLKHSIARDLHNARAKFEGLGEGGGQTLQDSPAT